MPEVTDLEAFRRQLRTLLFEAHDLAGIEVEPLLEALQAEQEYFIQQVLSPNYEGEVPERLDERQASPSRLQRKLLN